MRANSTAGYEESLQGPTTMRAAMSLGGFPPHAVAEMVR